MRKLILIWAVIILANPLQVPGQIRVNSELRKELLQETPGEGVFIHVNSGLFFPGEYLMYKVYVLQTSDHALTGISSMAYVELIGEDGKQVFIQKTPLDHGTGQAGFFVPASVPSGNYKLVGYTKWMRNQQEYFFQEDIVIINPYQSSQKRILQPGDSLAILPGEATVTSTENTQNLKIKLDRNSYGNREKVSVRFIPSQDESGGMNLSVSVRKISGISGPSIKRSTSIKALGSQSMAGEEKDIYLPELRGELLTGRIQHTGPSKETDLENRKISLSFPEGGPFPLISSTDARGRFFFNLDKFRRGEKALVEVLGEEKGEFEIQVEKFSGIDGSSLYFKSFLLTPEMEEEILERSVHNQIENAYFAVKPDTLITRPGDDAFYRSRMTQYPLDAYTRFKTIRETFVEIIYNAWITRDQEGNEVFVVRNLEQSIDMNQPPMVIIDGIHIQDHQELINMEANKIKTIGIIRDKIYIGPQIYQGAILVKTINGDFYENFSGPYVEKIELARPEIRTRYFKQQYDKDLDFSERIPDFRYQLLWEPVLNLSGNDVMLDFYTSDVDGQFEVVIEGFTEGGDPVSVRETFTVE